MNGPKPTCPNSQALPGALARAFLGLGSRLFIAPKSRSGLGGRKIFGLALWGLFASWPPGHLASNGLATPSRCSGLRCAAKPWAAGRPGAFAQKPSPAAGFTSLPNAPARAACRRFSSLRAQALGCLVCQPGWVSRAPWGLSCSPARLHAVCRPTVRASAPDHPRGERPHENLHHP